MNNIWVVNIVILKQSIVKKSHELVLTKIFMLQNFCLTPQLSKLVISSVKYLFVQTESQNLE